MICIKDAVT